MDLLTKLKQEPIVSMAISDYCTVDADTLVKDALDAMNAQKCHSALIVKAGKLVGIFTDRDVLMKIANNAQTLSRPISEFMTPDPITLPKTATPADALALMTDKHLRNIPIVEDNGSVIGNFTHFSVLDFLAEAFPDLAIEQNAILPRRFSRRRHGG